MTWILTKPDNDRFFKTSQSIKWIEWKEGRGENAHDEPSLGRSLMMSPIGPLHTWLTTPIVKIITKDENNFEFETVNSTYKLNKQLLKMENLKQTENTIKINQLETTGDVIRKISTEIEKFGITINVVDVQPEYVEYKIDVLK